MKVFITTSGIGSRMGAYTEYMNKSMLKVGKKPVISHIIEQYPSDFEFVITLGYKGDHIKQFLKIAYPNYKFTFVDIDAFQGPGTSQVYSQLQAKKYLQEPFIYNDCDTIVENLANQIDLTNFKHNFLVGNKKISGLYDGFNYDQSNMNSDNSYNITDIYRKSTNIDTMLSYIGIAGIYDYKTWWKCCEMAVKEVDYKILNDTYVFIKYKEYFKNLRTFIVDNWHDTGSISGLLEIRNKFSKSVDSLNVLDKFDQSIFIINGKVIKFFAKDGMVDKIMTHYDELKQFSPEIIDRTKNFFSYKYLSGNTAITNIDTKKFEDILLYYNENHLWDNVAYDDYDFKKLQYDFWITRTKERVSKCKQMLNISEDKDIVINGIKIPAKFTVDYMLDKVQEYDEWKTSAWTNWHGDFTLENIIKDVNDKLYLIDCRQGYMDNLKYGDKIYDFAKMNMNLSFNFTSIYNNLYNIISNCDNTNIHVDILLNSEAIKCKEIMKKFVEEKHNISYNYIEVLSGVIFLDLCSLFVPKLCKFLFYYGKYIMYTNLLKQNNI